MRVHDKKTHNQRAKSVAGKSKCTKTGVECQAKLAYYAQTASQQTPKQPKDERTNRQHVGKSLGTGVADVVVPKVDASDGCVDLQKYAGKRRSEHGYRG